MAKKKVKKNVGTIPMRMNSSVTVEKAGNGYILRMYDHTGNPPHDVVQVAKDDKEATNMMMKMMGMGGMKGKMKSNGKM